MTPDSLSDQQLRDSLAAPLSTLSSREEAVMNEIIRHYRSLPVMIWWRVPELILLTRIPWEEPVLDLGCGDGRMAGVVFDDRLPLRVGLDISAKDTRRAERTDHYDLVVRGDLCGTLPVADAQFATVFSNSVFEHLPRIDRLFHEIHRVLQPGGMLVFTVPSEHLNPTLRWPRRIRRLLGEGAAERWQRWWDRHVAHINLGGEPFWRAKMEEAGLEVTVCRPMLSPAVIHLSERSQMLHNMGLGKANIGNVVRALIELPDKLGWQAPGRFVERRLRRRVHRLLAEEPADPGSNLLFVARRPG